MSGSGIVSASSAQNGTPRNWAVSDRLAEKEPETPANGEEAVPVASRFLKENRALVGDLEFDNKCVAEEIVGQPAGSHARRSALRIGRARRHNGVRRRSRRPRSRSLPPQHR